MGAVPVYRGFSIAVVALAAFAAAPAGAGHGALAAAFAFDEGAGPSTADSSGHGLDGLLGSTPGADGNDPTWVAGLVGAHALRFDGGDLVRVPDAPELEPATVTVEAFVARSGSPPPVAYVVSKGADGCGAGSYAIYADEDARLRFYVLTASGYVESPSAGAGVWDGNRHHVLGSYDGQRVRFFVDGAEIGTGTPETRPIRYGLSPNEDLTIGAFVGSCFLGFGGTIDEVHVWDRALSAPEVADRAGDRDGVPQDVDNCPLVWNADQADFDGDGAGDACDADDDADGLADEDETNLHGSDPFDRDTDGDLFADGTEVAGGSDPSNPASVPTYAGAVTVTAATDGAEVPIADDLDPVA